MNPADLSAPPTPDAVSAQAARRRATFAALFGLATVGGPAMAQMGGGGGRGRHGQQPDTPAPDKDAKEDTHAPDAPRDLVTVFAARLREGVPDLTLGPLQQAAWRDFVASIAEVGQHNERRLQRIFWRSIGTVSAVSPLKSYIAAEVDEGEGRQEALSDLRANFDKLDAVLDEHQRSLVTNLFVATRSDLQASRAR